PLSIMTTEKQSLIGVPKESPRWIDSNHRKRQGRSAARTRTGNDSEENEISTGNTRKMSNKLPAPLYSPCAWIENSCLAKGFPNGRPFLLRLTVSSPQPSTLPPCPNESP